MKAFVTRLAIAFLLTVAFGLVQATGMTVSLTGAQEVPSVTTEATGTADIAVGMDRSVAGTVTTKGIAGTGAHIHLGGVGRNGPVIIALVKASDDEWTIPPGSKLTDVQYAAYKADQLYVNVQSDAYRDGEIRAQLKP